MVTIRQHALGYNCKLYLPPPYGVCRIKKRGIALIITIAFVAAIAALIGLSFGRLDATYAKVADKRFLVQGDMLLSKMFAVLKQASGDVNNSTTLDIFLSVPFAFENRDFSTSTMIAFTSAAGRPNINWLLDHNASQANSPYAPVPLDSAMEEYLDQILSFYNVSDRILFVSMVADTIDSDELSRSIGSEIAIESPDFTQGHLYDMRHFERLIDAYEKMTLDPAPRAVPWEALIGFKNETVDFNHITPEALSIMVPELQPDEVTMLSTERTDLFGSFDDLPFDSETKSRLEALHVAFYDPAVTGDILIAGGNRRLHATFLYNLGNKQVSDIEISQ